MRDIARVVAGLLAALVLARNGAVAAGSVAMMAATYLVALLVVVSLTLWRDGFVTASAVALAAHYGASLAYGRVSLDLGAPVVGALIVGYLEAADLAASLPSDRRVDRAFLLARIRGLGVVLGIAGLAGFAVYAVAAVPWPSGTAFRAAGVAGIALAAAVPLFALRARR
ncbi:MAG: hypothetical protein QOE45_148 [Frankiaceae bacterium]|jgi:hypothetical protein|nr:hypothetical protein [Frankiaceae bacterium]